MCEEAEARGDQQEHPLLSLLPVDAVVMPSMPVRVFMPTTVCPRNPATAKACTPKYFLTKCTSLGCDWIWDGHHLVHLQCAEVCKHSSVHSLLQLSSR